MITKSFWRITNLFYIYWPMKYNSAHQNSEIIKFECYTMVQLYICKADEIYIPTQHVSKKLTK